MSKARGLADLGNAYNDDALIMRGTGDNVAPSTDKVRLSGYGMIGNRETMYVTNPGGSVQLGVGTIHDNDPAFTAGATNTSHHPLSMGGQIDMNNNDIVGVDQIMHEGDSNTYIQFHAADQFRVVTGGSERLEVNNSRTQIDNLLVTGTTTLQGSVSGATTTTAGAVGTYMFANNKSGGTVSTGATVSGSSLRPTTAGSPSNTGYTMSGTWRLMGHKTGSNTVWAGEYESSLWVRVS